MKRIEYEGTVEELKEYFDGTTVPKSERFPGVKPTRGPYAKKDKYAGQAKDVWKNIAEVYMDNKGSISIGRIARKQGIRVIHYKKIKKYIRKMGGDFKKLKSKTYSMAAKRKIKQRRQQETETDGDDLNDRNNAA